ncbi:MAG: universal stress protein [Gemmatimonadaceae bacterium]
MSSTFASELRGLEADPTAFDALDRPRLRRLLVATDGRAQSAAALRMADALAQREGAEVRVIAVLPPAPYAPLYGVEVAMVPSETWERERAAAHRARMREHLLEVRGERDGSALGEVQLVIGAPSEAIGDVARSWGADLVLMGIGRHGAAARLVGETAVAVMRTARVPVLATTADGALPTRAVVAMDFTRSSLRAAALAAALLAPGGALALAHVEPDYGLAGREYDGWRRVYGEGVRHAFEAVRARLALPDGTTLEALVARGGGAAGVALGLAAERHAELIAVGQHGHDFVERLIVGSVATAIVRGARCPVLVAPPARRPEGR